MRRKLLAILGAMLLVATACSDDDAQVASEEAAQSESVEEVPETDDGADGELSVEEITDLLFPDFDPADVAAQEAEFEAQERERQQLIVECMAEQGFEYQPVSFNTCLLYTSDAADD